MWNRRLTALAGALTCVLVFGVAGCGSERAGETTNGSDSQEPGSQASAELASPVTFLRTGGLAGFHDELVVHPDGKVTLQGLRGEPFGCSVPRPLLGKLGDAVGAIQLKESELPAENKNEEPIPDELYTSVTIDGTEYDSAAASDDEGLDKTFTLMHDLLDSAYAAKDAGKSSCG